MFYEFPKITCLDDVRPAIEGRDEIKIMEREIEGHKYLIVDYIVAFADTFPNLDDPLAAIRRECRGLIFDANTEKLLARRYHKFFNINERVDTQIADIPFDEPFMTLDKLDGSMVSPFMFPNDQEVFWDVYSSPYITRTYWGTRKGATEVALGAEDFVRRSNYDYDGLAGQLILSGWTPIFEWMSPRFRIVVDYQKEDLVLTGVRNLYSGEYMPYEDMSVVADKYGIPVVERLSVEDIMEFLSESKSATEMEGYVLRWSNGHMVKSKNEWYLHIHKTKEQLVFEKDVIKIILGGNMDDILANLPPNDQERVRRYETSLSTGIHRVVQEINEFIEKSREELQGDPIERKRFAMEFVPKFPYDQLQRILYRVYFNGDDAFEQVCNYVLTNSSSRTKVDELREFLRMEWKPCLN